MWYTVLYARAGFHLEQYSSPLALLLLYIALLLLIYRSKHDHSEIIPGMHLPTTLLDSIVP